MLEPCSNHAHLQNSSIRRLVYRRMCKMQLGIVARSHSCLMFLCTDFCPTEQCANEPQPCSAHYVHLSEVTQRASKDPALSTTFPTDVS